MYRMITLRKQPSIILGLLLQQLLISSPIGSRHDGLAVAVPVTLSECYDEEPLHIAQVGNSMQYTNDSPRLLEYMFGGPCKIQQDSCLRSGATIPYLWHEGNGMRLIFRHTDDRGAPDVETLLDDDNLDFVVINDHTQSPARDESRKESLQSLRDDYVPLLKKHKITPVFILTPAYKVPCMRETEDLGDFQRFTELLLEGTELYKQKMDAWLAVGDFLTNPNPTNLTARIAPVGLVYARLHQTNPELWAKLYDPDNFHPSPHGTLLQAYVLYIAMKGEDPPRTYDPSTWWSRARIMQPIFEDPLPLPTVGESRLLRRAAIHVCKAYREGIISPVSKPLQLVCP